MWEYLAIFAAGVALGVAAVTLVVWRSVRNIRLW